MKKLRYTFLLPVLALLFMATTGSAQIIGPSSVGRGTTTTYYYDDGTTHQNIKWIAPAASSTSTSVSGTRYYASFTWSTRGSTTITLQDINGTLATKSVTVNVCSETIPPPIPNNASRCGPGSVTLSTNAAPLGYFLAWYDYNDPNLRIYIGDGDTNYTTPYLTATTSYYVAFYKPSSGCEGPKVTITATIDPPLAVNAGADQTGPSTCGITTVNLSASPSTGTWSVVSGAGGSFSNASSPTSAFSGIPGASYTLRWSTGSGNCTGYDDVNITFNVNPTVPNAGPDQGGAATCGLTTVTLSANTPSVGTGTWIVAPDCSPGGSVQNPSSASTAFTGPAGGMYCIVWKTTNGVCSLSDEVTVTLNRNPTPPNAGADQTGASTCGATSVALSANAPSIGTGNWSVVSGSGGAFSSSSNPASTFSGVPGAAYTLRWTTSNNPCPSSSDDVNVTFNRYPSPANAGPDRTGSATCGLTSVSLGASTPAVGSGIWSIVSGTGGSFGNPASPTSTFNGINGQAYTLRWSVSNGPCTLSSDDANVTFNQVPTASVSATSQAICSGSTATINVTNPNNVSGTNFVIAVNTTNAVIPDIVSPGNLVSGVFSNGDGINAGTAVYTITPYTSLCSGTPVTSTVNIRNKPEAPHPPSLLVYENNAATFQAIAPEGTQTQWYMTSAGNDRFSTGDTYQNTRVNDPLTYYVSFRDQASACESSRVPISAIPVGRINPASIISEAVRAPAQTTDGHINGLDNATQKAVTVFYLDGLSRISQTIGIKASPAQKDIVQPAEYDSYGRSSKGYLPYAQDNTTGSGIPAFQETYLADQLAFYTATNDKIANDDFPFVKTVFEASPLGRPLEQGKAGQAWQPGGGHTTRMAYSFNTSSDDIRIFTYPFTEGALASLASYAANTLNRIEKTDENGNREIIFVNGAGQTIVRKAQLDGTINGTTVSYLSTYYVYDDKGQPRYIIPPGGFEALKANGWMVSQALLDQHVYQFVYDNRGRLSRKKTPGQAWIYYGFDRLNRLVLLQDGNLRPQNKWAFVKYDQQGRAVITGLYRNTSQTDPASVQAILDGQYAGTGPHYEKRGMALHGYTNQSFPTINADNTALEILNVNYFDDYDFDNNGAADFSYDNTHLTGLPARSGAYIRGLPTGGRKLILGTSNWIVSAVFYDDQGRVIQSQSNNHMNLGATDKSSVTYDFEGKVLQTKSNHSGSADAVTVVQTPVYDWQGRLNGLKHSINGATDQLVSQYQYNELGQAVTRQLHSTGAGFLQNVDYRYSINGWLESINNAQLTDDGDLTNGDNNDYFGMELLYNTVGGSGLNGTALYNGNVSAVKWKGMDNGTGTTGQQSYTFSYDKTGKLLTSTFKKHGASSWDQEQNTLNESMSYDHNGNVLGLQRSHNVRGLSGTTVTSAAELIDNLTYDYAGGDKLFKVTDATTSAAGFNDGTNAATEYAYDSHGNVTQDLNKGISNITYNVLGKAQQITFTDGRIVNYTYDAGGNKLKMAATVNGTTTTTDYVGGFVYTNNTLSFFSSPEGRVVKNGSNYEYQYAIADHQGNTRVVFSASTPAPDAPVATFEGDANDGGGAYANIDANKVISHIGANHSTGGSKAIRMNQTYKVGPSKSLRVFPGDQVNMEVWEYHEASSGFGTASTPLTTLITMVSGVFGGSAGGPGESGLIYNGVDHALTGFGAGGSKGDTRPAAYLNFILFDKDFNVLDAGWQLAPATTFTKQKLSFPTKTIKDEGYLFVYLSYEGDSDNWVYFDDLKVTHTKTNVIQYNEYYPFGLQTAGSWTRDDASNNFLYNEGSELNTTSGFYDLPFRNYDAALGRFFQVDPLAHWDHSVSPFAYARNNPAVLNDPSGLMVPAGWSDAQMRAVWRAHSTSYSSFEDWAIDGGPNGGGNVGGGGGSSPGAGSSGYWVSGESYSWVSNPTTVDPYAGYLKNTGTTSYFVPTGGGGSTWLPGASSQGVGGGSGSMASGPLTGGVGQQGTSQNILIGGMDMTYSGPSEITKKIQQAIGGTVYNYNLYEDVDHKFVTKIVGEIKKDYKSGNRVQIYGYSKGGDIAMQVTRGLNAIGIPVSLLITIDAADGPLSDELNRSIPGNVSINFNFYQMTPSLIRSHGGPNTGSGLIFNFDLTGSFNHSNIDDASVNTAIYLLGR